MNLYAESSAVLAWLLNEPDAAQIGACLANAEWILTSDLTLVECDRALIRCVTGGDLSEAEASSQRARLNRTAGHWIRLALVEEVLERARRPFPGEPVRSLDALHLSSALFAKGAVSDLQVLTLDRRVQACAVNLGFQTLP